MPVTADPLLIWLTSGVSLTLAGLSGLIAVAESALAHAARPRLRGMAQRGDAGAARALTLSANGEALFVSLRLTRLLAVLSATASAAVALAAGIGWIGLVAALVLCLGFLLLGGDVLLHTAALRHPEATAARLSRVAHAAMALGMPLGATARRLPALLGLEAGSAELRAAAGRAGIAGAIVAGHSDGHVEKASRDLLMGAFDLADRTVEEVMRHRSQIEMIDAEKAPGDILTQALASPYTRLPIYRSEAENILGVLHAKDLLREVDRLVRGDEGNLAAIADLDVLKIAMKPYFVPDTTPLDEQLRAFLERRTQLALVVDEYGALQGLITLEDILEEIVGEITDEFDVVDREAAPRPTDSGDYVIDGAMTIRDLNRLLDWRLPDDEANTVAGLVIHEAQTIPAEGQTFSFYGFRFEVAARRENRITRLKVRPL